MCNLGWWGEPMDNSFADRIYEAGAIPELWLGVLDDLARMVGGIGACLLVPTSGRWVASERLVETASILFDTGLIRDNARTNRLLAKQHAGFVTDHDIFSADEIPHEPIYRDFFIPRGGGLGAATVISSPSGDTMIFHAERPISGGPLDRSIVDALDGLRPHFARASLLSARLELQRAQAATDALQAIGLPAAVLRIGGRIVNANAAMAALVPSLILDSRARIRLTNAASDALLDKALAEIATDETAVRSIPVSATEELPPQIVHLVPVRRAAHDVFGTGMAIVVVTPVVPKEVPTADVIQGLFDLTPAEARVARQIGNGRSTAEIAVDSAVHVETVRTQIKAVLGKTGLHRQTDLVALLQGASLAHHHTDD